MSAVFALVLGLAVVVQPQVVPSRPDGDGYTIDTSQTTRDVKVGATGLFVLHIEAAPGSKVSRDAPLTIELSSDGVSLTKTLLRAKDAVARKAQGRAGAVARQAQGRAGAAADGRPGAAGPGPTKSPSPTFNVRFRGKREGETSIAVQARFFVCDDKTCERKVAQLSVPISVRP